MISDFFQGVPRSDNKNRTSAVTKFGFDITTGKTYFQLVDPQDDGGWIATAGGGGTPGGNNGDIQYNNSSNFGGFADGTGTQVLHGGRTFSQVVNGDIANATIDVTSKITGVVPAANGGVNTITTGGIGKVFVPACDPDYNQLLNNTTAGFPINTSVVRVWLFDLDRMITVNKVVLDLSAASGNAGSHAYVGLYDQTGTTRLMEASFDATSATVQSVTLGSPLTLAPGSYYMAFGCDATSGVVTSRNAFAVTTGFTNLLGKNVKRFDTAPTTISGGHLPANITPLSSITVAGAAIPIFLMEN